MQYLPFLQCHFCVYSTVAQSSIFSNGKGIKSWFLKTRNLVRLKDDRDNNALFLSSRISWIYLMESLIWREQLISCVVRWKIYNGKYFTILNNPESWFLFLFWRANLTMTLIYTEPKKKNYLNVDAISIDHRPHYFPRFSYTWFIHWSKPDI